MPVRRATRGDDTEFLVRSAEGSAPSVGNASAALAAAEGVLEEHRWTAE